MALPHSLHDTKTFRDFSGIDGQITPELGFDNNLNDQSQHRSYTPPPFHVAGFAPVVQLDGSDGGVGGGGGEYEWNYGVEPSRKKVKEQDFMDNGSSQISSIDFWQARSVSTGLGLSLDNARIASSDGSALMSLVGEDIERELQRQDAEIERFLKVQGDQLRHAILDKVQKSQQKTVSLMEEKVLQKLREKDEELEIINQKNKELEVRMEQLSMEAEAWQHRAKYNENMIAALNYNLERANHAPRARESIEGCGDSEVDDTASCFNGRNNNNNTKATMLCRSCGVNKVCMLLLPCKHMCLCKGCESKLSFCPLCQSSKFLGMEVYM